MSNFGFWGVRPSFRLASVWVFLALTAVAIGQGLTAGDGLGQIWKVRYNAEGIDPNADSDGDGLSNRQEAVAGTDPFDSKSAARISLFTLTTNGAQTRIAGELGKRYELQGTEAVCGSSTNNWFTEAAMVARTNNIVTLSTRPTSPMRFFRVVVSDVDTDGDGLTDWEEYQLGLDPFSASSNGQLDSNGKPLGDYQYAVNWLRLRAKVAGSGVAGLTPASVVLYVAGAGGTNDGTGLTAEYFTNASTTYESAINFNPTNLFLTTNDAAIDFRWGPTNSPNLSNLVSCVRWTGQVQPLTTEKYIFEARTDDGVKLWVNDQLVIDQWHPQGFTSWTGVLNLVAGVRYNLKMEYFNIGGAARAQLFWYSPSQARQIIPTARLFPASDGLDPGGITSPLYAVAFLGQPFSYTIKAANSPNSFDATNLPPGLTLNAGTGVISGIPGAAGNYAVGLTAVNNIGPSTNTLNLQVVDTGSAVTREVWLDVTGTSVTNIPLGSTPSSRGTLGTLVGITNFGDNYGERIRGYLTAPASGNYYFWLKAKDDAELWISNDEEPANKVLRASISKPVTKGKKKVEPIDQSSWLALEEGKRYYLEILHKAGKGPGDYWSVSWLLDPVGTNSVPGPVVPGYVLSPFVETPVTQIPGTLYSANMLAQAGIQSSGVGSATLRLSADGTKAILKFTYGGLTSAKTAQHIHADTYQGKNQQGQIIFDIDTVTPDADTNYVWNLAPSGPLTVADQVEIIKQGKAYMNVHTVNFPGGEINGHLTLTDGTMTFTPPPAPPAWTDDHTSSNAIARFLQQATFGASRDEMKSVKTLGYEGWLKKQFRTPVTSHLKNVIATMDPNGGFSSEQTFNTWWKHSVTAPDQLRQRVAFALSEIMVVSAQGVNPPAVSAYYDVLLNNAFGNFRELLEGVTLSPAMGAYLNMLGNDKEDVIRGTHPNENYAREIMQLFSIGLNRMWPDGSLVLSSKGEPVPTYDQNVIIGYSRVFTGWNYSQTNRMTPPPGVTNKNHKLIQRLPNNWYPGYNYTNPMVLVPTHHELGTKALLDKVVLPAAWGSQADPASTNFDKYCSQDIELALDTIFNNPNVGPFICRQLIQRLVTSHPSRDYLYRVVQKFNDNGAGVRGDLKAVITAILLDYEARADSMVSQVTYGKQREPVLRATAIARAFPAPPPVHAAFHQKGDETITIKTAKSHRLNTGDDVYLAFSGARGPASGRYSDVVVTNEKSFNIRAAGISTGGYGQSGTLITVTNSGHNLTTGDQLYLTFTSGGARNGIYKVVSTSGSIFTINATEAANRVGRCVFPKWQGTDLTFRSNYMAITTSGPHGLGVGSKVYVHFMGYPALSNGVFRVTKVLGPTRFAIPQVSKIGQYSDTFQILPLQPVPTRSGSVTIGYSTWEMNYTDDGYNSSLSQTPLNSPTVFNFFFPDYKFPGLLAASGMTTPEFQLTSDSSVVMQLNFMAGALFNNGNNTNGLSSFSGGNGAIVLDLSPWMTPAYTADSGIPTLVDALNTVLMAGQLSPSAKQLIVNYVANPRFVYTTPTSREMRDRVRAVVHLLVTSPEFTIQR